MDTNDASALGKRATLPWQARTARRLSAEDHRQITTNLTGFFETLAAWKKQEMAMTSSSAVATASSNLGEVSR